MSLYKYNIFNSRHSNNTHNGELSVHCGHENSSDIDYSIVCDYKLTRSSINIIKFYVQYHKDSEEADIIIDEERIMCVIDKFRDYIADFVTINDIKLFINADSLYDLTISKYGYRCVEITENYIQDIRDITIKRLNEFFNTYFYLTTSPAGEEVLEGNLDLLSSISVIDWYKKYVSDPIALFLAARSADMLAVSSVLKLAKFIKRYTLDGSDIIYEDSKLFVFYDIRRLIHFDSEESQYHEENKDNHMMFIKSYLEDYNREMSERTDRYYNISKGKDDTNVEILIGIFEDPDLIKKVRFVSDLSYFSTTCNLSKDNKISFVLDGISGNNLLGKKSYKETLAILEKLPEIHISICQILQNDSSYSEDDYDYGYNYSYDDDDL